MAGKRGFSPGRLLFLQCTLCAAEDSKKRGDLIFPEKEGFRGRNRRTLQIPLDSVTSVDQQKIELLRRFHTNGDSELIRIADSSPRFFAHVHFFAPFFPSSTISATSSAAFGKAMAEAACSMAARIERFLKKPEISRSTSGAVLARIPAPFSWR